MFKFLFRSFVSKMVFDLSGFFLSIRRIQKRKTKANGMIHSTKTQTIYADD